MTLNEPRDGALYGLDLNAQSDRVDLVARVQRNGGYELEHAQSFPGLTLVARGGKRASFRVLDAGAPVSGATVSVAGRSATTGRDGRVQIGVATAGRYTAHATAPQYVGARATVRIISP